MIDWELVAALAVLALLVAANAIAGPRPKPGELAGYRPFTDS